MRELRVEKETGNIHLLLLEEHGVADGGVIFCPRQSTVLGQQPCNVACALISVNKERGRGVKCDLCCNGNAIGKIDYVMVPRELG